MTFAPTNSVFKLGVQWETADFICTNLSCQRVTDGYGNYVSKLKKENEQLKEEIQALRLGAA